MSSVVLLSREDIVKDPELMSVWVEQNLSKNNLAVMEGCAFAIKEFGNNRPFSNIFIYRLECMEKYKDKRKQLPGKIGGMSHTTTAITKKQLLSKLSKLPKSKLKSIVNESENSSVMFSESMDVLSREY